MLAQMEAPTRGRRTNLQVWTLLDMLRVFGGRLLYALYQAGRFQRGMTGEHVTVEDASSLVKLIQQDIHSLPISYATEKKVERLRKLLDASDPDAASRELTVRVSDRLDELVADLTNEMCEDLYLCVLAEWKGFYLEPETWFGERVSRTFTAARNDIIDCAQCLALGRYTASVYHAMLVFQQGMYWLADELSLTFPKSIELLEWHTVIERAQAEIRKRGGQPKTEDERERLARLSDIASHLYHVKDAWRNFVAHGRARYSEADALDIATNVRGFMTKVTELASPTPPPPPPNPLAGI